MYSFVFRFAQCFLFILPFQFALAPVPGVDLPLSRVLAPLLFLSWLASGLARRRLRLPFDAIGAGLLIFLFFGVLSLFFAERSDWAVRRLTFLLTFLPLFPVFVGVIAEYGRDGIRRLLVPFVAGATLVALSGIFQFLLQFPFGVASVFRFWTGMVFPFFLGPGFSSAVAEYPSLLVDLGGHAVLRASAFFPDPHMFAFYVGMAWPVALSLVREAKTPVARCLSAVAVVLLPIADILSFSRGGYVGLAFGIALLVVMVSEGRDVMKRVLVVAGLSSALFLSFVFDTPVRSRFFSVFSVEEGSNEGRLALFREAGGKIAERPLGYGLGNYPLAVKPTADYREPIYAHDIFLDIATEYGVFGMAVFLFAVCTACFRLFRSRGEPLLRAGAVSLAIFFGHALFETPLYSVHILPVLLLFLALPSTCGRIEA